MNRPSKFKRRDIRLAVSIKAAPERVYAAATSARQLCTWWVDRAETDIRNQGRFRLLWPAGGGSNGAEGRGVFADLEPGRKLAWLWDKRSLPRGAPPMTGLFIEPRRGGCRVTLRHAGFSASRSSDRIFERYARGWEDFLAKLALYAETGGTCKSSKITLAELDPLRKKKRR